MKPILFNTEMVRAILDGRKTVTRRVIRWDKVDNALSCPYRRKNIEIPDDKIIERLCGAPYRMADILYVRETWTILPVTPGDNFRPSGVYYYRADGDMRPDRYRDNGWHPSIHMPKEAARIFLRVQDVHVERVQEITGAECVREGIPQESLKEVGEAFTLGQFADLWDSTVKPSDRALYGWDANPWVWVIDFERISRDEALKEESK
ncbi:hypothetical protein DBY21_08385 [Candidatus Gastranaerophilales bacterium]|nr:MAG: hypothetical protein DBY21_08385 [Candidatus Gastranaerophilales bacterium]